MISEAMLRRPLSAAMRRQAYVLVALLALLMPALLPYGSQPVAALGSYIAPHSHTDAATAAAHHHHSGDGEAMPEPAKLLAPPALAVLLITALLLRAGTGAPAPVARFRAVVRPRPFSPARPRAPPVRG